MLSEVYWQFWIQRVEPVNALAPETAIDISNKQNQAIKYQPPIIKYLLRLNLVVLLCLFDYMAMWHRPKGRSRLVGRPRPPQPPLPCAVFLKREGYCAVTWQSLLCKGNGTLPPPTPARQESIDWPSAATVTAVTVRSIFNEPKSLHSRTATSAVQHRRRTTSLATRVHLSAVSGHCNRALSR